MTIAVSAATGQLGRLVIDRLLVKGRGADVVAIARNPGKAEALGVPVREGDYAKPETMLKALDGVATLLLISSSEIGQRAAQHHNAIEASKAAGVKHIVYTSLLHADTSGLNLAEEHRITEAELKASGIDFTILRNGWYTENYASRITGAVAAGALIGSAGDGKVSSAARSDFADAAVAALTGAGHAGKTYELAGDEAYTLAGLAAEISRQSGKTILYKNLPETDFAAALAGFGLPEWLAKALASWDVATADGALFDAGQALSHLIGRPTTSLASSVAAALQ